MLEIPKKEDSIFDWIPFQYADVWANYGIDTIDRLYSAYIGNRIPNKIQGPSRDLAINLVKAYIAKVPIELHCEIRGEKLAEENLAPTGESPGTAEKIEVFRWRLENGLPLFHKDDAGPFKDFRTSRKNFQRRK